MQDAALVLARRAARDASSCAPSRRRSRAGSRSSSSASPKASAAVRRVPRASSTRSARRPTAARCCSRSRPRPSRRSSIAEIARMVRERQRRRSRCTAACADLALVTSAMLMAISDRGIDGNGGMGLWGPVVFTIPLLAAWYSYEHLDVDPPHVRPDDPRARRRARARRHGARRARRACRRRSPSPSASELGFSRHELEQLETAALLHHLGQVCLDEPDDGRPPEPVAVAQAGAAILRSTQLLAPAGDIIAAESMPYREQVGVAPVGDVGPDPEGRERVRRAVATGSPTARPARARSALLGAGVPLRRARCSARSRSCSTGAACSTITLVADESASARTRAAPPWHAARLEAHVDDRRARSRCRRSRTAGSGSRAR